MSKKSTKTTGSSGAAKPAPTAEAEIIVEPFQHCCTTENFALVWLDEDFEEKNPNCRKLTQQLQTIIKKLDVFNDTDDCLNFVNEIRTLDVYMIMSSPDEQMLARADQVNRVKAIFIFDDKNSSKDSWTKQYKKLKGIYTSVDALCQRVKETAKSSDNDFNELCFIASKDIANRGLDELDQSFMYTQLIKEILLRLKYDDDCVRKLVTYCTTNQNSIKVKLNGLQEFNQGYGQKETAVWWYTKDIFAYALVNWALREQEFDTIIRVGFFINDLHRHIVELHEEQASARKSKFLVYRGQGMTLERFAELKESRGGLLAFNNFVSTSTDSQVAHGFVKGALIHGAAVGIIFTIIVDPSVRSAVYADVSKVSFFKKSEAEVLFSLATVFRIGDITPIQSSPQVWSVELQLTSSEDRELNALMDRIRVEIGGSTPLYQLGALMIKVGQYNKAEEIYTELQNVTNDEPGKANIYYQLGFIKYKQGNPRKALEFYQKALSIHLKASGADHHNVATVYNNMGLAHDSLNDQSQALACYQQARKIYEKSVSSNDPVLAACYNNIASIYDHKQDHEQALIYYKKASEIYKSQPTTNHPDVATLENNIGLLHLKKGEHKQALERFQNALQIGTKALPPGHTDLKTYKQHLDTVKAKANKYK
jgi:Tfp pilus assembly protein PilF